MNKDFIKKLQDLINEYSGNCEGKECENDQEVKPEGKMIVIKGKSESDELPEDIQDLIHLIRRG